MTLQLQRNLEMESRKHLIISNQFDISFGRFEEGRCDDRVMVSEVSLHKNSQEKKIQMKIVYDQFTVSPQLTKAINNQLSGLPIMERAKSVMSLINGHFICVSWFPGIRKQPNPGALQSKRTKTPSY